MPLLWMLIAILASSGVVLAGAALIYPTRRSAPHRIREENKRKSRGAKLVRSAVMNSTVSVAAVLLVTEGLYTRMFYEALPAWWVLVLEVAGILLLYDLLYYLTHRYAFHQWRVLRGVHAVHHTARYPTAVDALYIHPVETLIGVGLLLGCTFVVGPVNIYAFAVVFLVYSWLNILIHAGLSVSVFPLRSISYLARKHDIHHISMQGGNYASITPLWDWILGTAQ